MVATRTGQEKRGRRRRPPANPAEAAPRTRRYRHLANPFKPVGIFSDDELEHIHASALKVLQDIGIRVLLPEARDLLRGAGAIVDDDSMLVRIGRDVVERALSTIRPLLELNGADADHSVKVGGPHVAFFPVGGPPNVSDMDRGRRTGTISDFEDLARFTQAFDVLHLNSPSVEPMDIVPALRHYAVTKAQLTLTRKAPFVFSRGAAQVADCFEMIRAARGLTGERFREGIWVYTVINTNSPLQLDVPMMRGLIDFARAGQLVIVTPFTLSGAMAPITIPGALTQQHAEAMAGLTVSQLAAPGAPVAYGGFTSNVDMKSGAPAFGTPEYVKAALGTGQLARRLNVPWRSSNATASNAPDAQAAYEAQMSIWGAMMGGCNMLMHGAGWLEGGLTASFEKFMIDIEMLQMFAELFQPTPVTDDEIGVEAIREVGPGGHYFAGEHTMSRYQTAFYPPILSDWSNFGQWTEKGSLTAAQRANAMWKKTLEEYEAPALEDGAREELEAFIERRTREGGAPPES